MKTITLLSLTSLMLLSGTALMGSQSFNVSGRVTDGDGKPLQGVRVTIENTKNTTTTSGRGYYAITAAKGDYLIFALEGYEQQRHKVTGSTLNIIMLPEDVLSSETKFTPPVIKKGEYVVEEDLYELSEVVVLSDMSIDVQAFAATSASRESYYPGGEEYSDITENRFKSVSRSPLSTFSLDVDGASYSNARRIINSGCLPEADAVRVEEFVNYFSYNYHAPKGNDPVRISYEVGQCPWNTQHKLVSIGVKAKEIPSDKLPVSNFVFLIDVSGSMYGRLDMVKSSMKLLVNNLRNEDRVAIVTYANGVEVKLPSTSGGDKQKIRDVLDALEACGATAGGRGIQLAYETARKNFVVGGNNRVILCTDGDFNVGPSSPQELENLIEKERKSGVFLTVLGYGMGNYKDNRIQVLAEKGNGNHAYIDSMQEANRVLVNEFGSTMYTVAKDVKIQVEFNPSFIQSYRLVGYESRLLNDEDFNDDSVDAGELGAGHTVTALYEIVPVGVNNAPGSVDPLKYQKADERLRTSGHTDELMTVKLRYKEPNGDVSKKIEIIVKDTNNANSVDFRFAAAAAMFGQLLRDSSFKGDATYAKTVELARKSLGGDPQGYRRELVRLAETAGQLSTVNRD